MAAPPHWRMWHMPHRHSCNYAGGVWIGPTVQSWCQVMWLYLFQSILSHLCCLWQPKAANNKKKMAPHCFSKLPQEKREEINTGLQFLRAITMSTVPSAFNDIEHQFSLQQVSTISHVYNFQIFAKQENKKTNFLVLWLIICSYFSHLSWFQNNRTTCRKCHLVYSCSKRASAHLTVEGTHPIKGIGKCIDVL